MAESATAYFYFFRRWKMSFSRRSTNKTNSVKTVKTRWKHDELFDDGFVGVPTHFLRLYSLLQPPLTSGEAMFIIQLMNFKWDELNPFPSYKLLAERMGVSSKATQRHAATLESKKYLKRIARVGTSNEFDLSQLFDAVLNLQRTVPKRLRKTEPELDAVQAIEGFFRGTGKKMEAKNEF
jgi:hypothetical protein